MVSAFDEKPSGGAAAGSAGGRARGLWEWLFRGGALREATQRGLSPRQLESLARARLAYEVAARCMAPADAFENGSAAAPAISMLREAAFFALDALRADNERRFDGVADAFENGSRGALLEVAGGGDALAPIAAALANDSFVATYALADDRAAALSRQLYDFTGALLRVAAQPDTQLQTTQRERVLRPLWMAGVAIGVVLFAIYGIRWLRTPRDLADAKPWRASSSYDAFPASGRTDQHPQLDVMFHTADEANPSLEIDLQVVQRVRGIHVENRRSCCTERAVPLIVEVAGADRNFKQVARKDDNFTDWTTMFPPVEGRYVRLSVAKKTMFHLSAVHVY